MRQYGRNNDYGCVVAIFEQGNANFFQEPVNLLTHIVNHFARLNRSNVVDIDSLDGLRPDQAFIVLMYDQNGRDNLFPAISTDALIRVAEKARLQGCKLGSIYKVGRDVFCLMAYALTGAVSISDDDSLQETYEDLILSDLIAESQEEKSRTGGAKWHLVLFGEQRDVITVSVESPVILGTFYASKANIQAARQALQGLRHVDRLIAKRALEAHDSPNAR